MRGQIRDALSGHAPIASDAVGRLSHLGLDLDLVSRTPGMSAAMLAAIDRRRRAEESLEQLDEVGLIGKTARLPDLRNAHIGGKHHSAGTRHALFEKPFVRRAVETAAELALERGDRQTQLRRYLFQRKVGIDVGIYGALETRDVEARIVADLEPDHILVVAHQEADDERNPQIVVDSAGRLVLVVRRKEMTDRIVGGLYHINAAHNPRDTVHDRVLSAADTHSHDYRFEIIERKAYDSLLEQPELVWKRFDDIFARRQHIDMAGRNADLTFGQAVIQTEYSARDIPYGVFVAKRSVLPGRRTANDLGYFRTMCRKYIHGS